MSLLKLEFYTRQYIRGNPEFLFVFGDNMQHRGFGGQAKEARGEPNAVGVPTKWAPSMHNTALFSDADTDVVLPKIREVFDKLELHLMAGGIVVWPAKGVGTGFADMPARAPKLFNYIQERLNRMEAFK